MINGARIVSVALVAAQAAQAQTPPTPPFADSSPAAIMRRVGAHPDNPGLLALLRCQMASCPQRTIDAVADSLTARAAAAGKSLRDELAFRQAQAALMALGQAGATRGSSGRPYAGAAERLIRVHRESHERRIRSLALAMLPGVTDRPRALRYLGQIAASTDATAYTAFTILGRDAEGAGLAFTPSPAQRKESDAILRDLAVNHLTRDPIVARELKLWLELKPHAP